MSNNIIQNRREFIKSSSNYLSGIILSNSLMPYISIKKYLSYENLPDVYIVPNMHPASCGWLTNFSSERNYCANTYFAHMDKVNNDSNYKFVISEVNNMIAMLNFQPKRFEELKRGIEQKKIEAVNGMFLELTPNLSTGESIVRMGINGINWQEKMLNVKPRFNWMIDVTGFHEQLAQISAGLGLEAMVHCRQNVSGSPLYLAESPDGTKLLTISPGHYASFGSVFNSLVPLKESEIETLGSDVKRKNALGEMPYLILGGSGDYSLPPQYARYPTDFINTWEKDFHGSKLKFSTLSTYVDLIRPMIDSEKVIIPTVKDGWGYSWDAFWVENPKVKSLYRKNELALQSTEKLASISSLISSYKYPTQDLYHAWLQLHLNTDRNTLWGAAGGMVFENKESWDVLDRFNWITNQTNKIRQSVLKKEKDNYISYFNSLNWQQEGPQYINYIKGRRLKNFKSQKINNHILFFPKLDSFGVGSFETDKGEGNNTMSESSTLPQIIRNKFYEIVIDPMTGEITKLVLLKSNKTIINKGNVFYSDRRKDDEPIYHNLPKRDDRLEYESTIDKVAIIEYIKGELAQIVKIKTSLHHQNDINQTIIIYNDHPRIDFEVFIDNLPDKTVTFMDFIPEYGIISESRGIPYGFTTETTESLSLREEGVHPVICWSSYNLRNGSGFALLDRGLPGREISGKKVSMMLDVSSEIYMGYPGGWLSGKGEQYFQFAFVGFDGKGDVKELQQFAKEYNSPLLFQYDTSKLEENSFITSSDNIIIESLQRVEDELEIRFVECIGISGTAKIEINLPVLGNPRLTNFMGEGDEILATNNDQYLIPVRPQQIVTIRVKTQSNVGAIVPLKDWSLLVPEHKRKFLQKYDKTLIGHPPY